MAKDVRHILGLSGGKDSAALAILLHKKVPQMEYFFCDTGKELPETYEFLERMKARLGIKIVHLSAERGFDHWLNIYGGFLPSPQVRWCTRQLKLKPLEKFIGDDEAISYIGIRADEDRDGYIAKKPNIRPVYPFKELGLNKTDIFRILEESGVGVPSYYKWRSRSGCYFCFFQRNYEWVKLAEMHPDLFALAVQYEQEHSDGRKFYWNQSESLLSILDRKEQIIAAHEANLKKQNKLKKNRTLLEVFESTLDDEDDTSPCLACHL